MPARQKLNGATVNGALLIAGLAGAAFASWPVFLLVGLVLVTSAVIAGDIRLTPRR